MSIGRDFELFSTADTHVSRVESGAMYCVAIAVYLIAVPTHEEFTTAYYSTSDIVLVSFNWPNEDDKWC